MRQAVLVEPKHIEFREVEAPKASDLKEHQVLLNIKRIGICGSCLLYTSDAADE